MTSTDELSTLTESQLVERVSLVVWEDAVYSTRTSQEAVDSLHDFLKDRPWLYQRGWNRAYKEAGHRLSAGDIERASEDFYKQEQD